MSTWYAWIAHTALLIDSLNVKASFYHSVVLEKTQTKKCNILSTNTDATQEKQ